MKACLITFGLLLFFSPDLSAQCPGGQCGNSVTVDIPRIDWSPQVTYEQRQYQFERPAPIQMQPQWVQPQQQQQQMQVPALPIRPPVIGPRLWQGPLWTAVHGRYRWYW